MTASHCNIPDTFKMDTCIAWHYVSGLRETLRLCDLIELPRIHSTFYTRVPEFVVRM